MALFSRKKNANDVQEPREDAAAALDDSENRDAAAAPEPAPGDVPQVQVSVAPFQGLGAPTVGTPVSAEAPAEDAAEVLERKLPLAPVEPPSEWETIPGMRDNAVLRDALAELGEEPSGLEIAGILRQLLQGHLFLRVKGDAREQMANGGNLEIGIAREGDSTFVLAFSSGRALNEAVAQDGDTATSAVMQPVSAVIQQLANGPHAGVILDAASGNHRAALPMEMLTRAYKDADPELKIKTLLGEARGPENTAAIVEALGTTQLWVAVGEVAGDEGSFGVAEARMPDGTRLVQLFSHPLEVIVLGRNERPAPLEPGKLADILRDHAEIAGVVIDAAGPSILLSRADLEPLLAAE